MFVFLLQMLTKRLLRMLLLCFLYHVCPFLCFKVRKMLQKCKNNIYYFKFSFA